MNSHGSTQTHPQHEIQHFSFQCICLINEHCKRSVNKTIWGCLDLVFQVPRGLLCRFSPININFEMERVKVRSPINNHPPAQFNARSWAFEIIIEILINIAGILQVSEKFWKNNLFRFIPLSENHQEKVRDYRTTERASKDTNRLFYSSQYSET